HERGPVPEGAGTGGGPGYGGDGPLRGRQPAEGKRYAGRYAGGSPAGQRRQPCFGGCNYGPGHPAGSGNRGPAAPVPCIHRGQRPDGGPGQGRGGAAYRGGLPPSFYPDL